MEENKYPQKTVITLEMIAQQKAAKRKELQQVKEDIALTLHELFDPVENKGGAMGFMQHVNTGIAMYDGVKTGIKIIRRIRGFFQKKRK